MRKVIDGRALLTKHLISKRNFRNSLLWQGRSRDIRYHIRVELLRRYEVGCALIIEPARLLQGSTAGCDAPSSPWGPLDGVLGWACPRHPF